LYIIEIFPLLQFFIHKLAQSDEIKRKKMSEGNVRAGSSLRNIMRHEISPLTLCCLWTVRFAAWCISAAEILEVYHDKWLNYIKEGRDVVDTCHKIARGQFDT